MTAYPPPFYEPIDTRDRLLQPHIYPGQTITSARINFFEDKLNVGSSTVRWTS